MNRLRLNTLLLLAVMALVSVMTGCSLQLGVSGRVVPGGVVISRSVPVHLTGSVLTNKSSALAGKNVPMDKFTTEDIIGYFCWFSWDDVTRPGGMHDVTWNWYQNGTLVSTGSKHIFFAHAPYRLWSTRTASAFGPGKFRIDVLVDGEVRASTKFEIR